MQGTSERLDVDQMKRKRACRNQREKWRTEKAKVGSAQSKFTWILRDCRGKALSFDERSSMEDAAGTLCKAAKTQ
jgi:hypothetical protein